MLHIPNPSRLEPDGTSLRDNPAIYLHEPEQLNAAAHCDLSSPSVSIPVDRIHLDTPSPGIYAVMTLPLLNRTLATFLSPELGFFGFVVPTRRQTPFISGLLTNAGDVGFRARCSTRHPRRTWLYVAWRDEALEKDRVDKLVGGVNIVVREPRAADGSRSIALNILKAMLVVMMLV